MSKALIILFLYCIMDYGGDEIEDAFNDIWPEHSSATTDTKINEPVEEYDFELQERVQDYVDKQGEAFDYDLTKPENDILGGESKEPVNLMDRELGVSDDIQEMFENLNADLDKAITNPEATLEAAKPKLKPDEIEISWPKEEFDVEEWSQALETAEMNAEEAEEVSQMVQLQSTLMEEHSALMELNTETYTRLIGDGNINITSEFVNEMFGDMSADVAGEVGAEIAAEAAGETAAATTMETIGLIASRAAAVLGPIAAAAGVVMAVRDIVVESERIQKMEKTYDIFGDISTQSGKSADIAMSLFNQNIKKQKMFVQQYYKYVRNSQDPKGLSQNGPGRWFNEYEYKSDFGKISSDEAKYKIAYYLTHVYGLPGTTEQYHNMLDEDNFWGKMMGKDTQIGGVLDHKTTELLYGDKLQSMYEGMDKAYKFNKYMESLHKDQFSQGQDVTKAAAVMLSTRDTDMLNHFQEQAMMDKGYEQALDTYVKTFNAKRIDKGLEPIDKYNLEYAYTPPNQVSAFFPSYQPKVRFWAIYYKMNKTRFMARDMKEIMEKKLEFIKRGRTKIEPKPETAEERRIRRANNRLMTQIVSHESEVGYNQKMYIDENRIVRKGKVYNDTVIEDIHARLREEEAAERNKTFQEKDVEVSLKRGFQRKPRKRRRVIDEKATSEEKASNPKRVTNRRPPKDTYNEKDTSKKKNISPKHIKKRRPPKSSYRESDFTGGSSENLNLQPQKIHHFEEVTPFSLEIANHLAYLCDKAYEAENVPAQENDEMRERRLRENEDGYDEVEFLGSESSFASTQGRMYWKEADRAITIVYRGTDFGMEIDKFLSDAFIDARINMNTYLGMEVHSGFLAYFQNSLNQVTQFIDKHYDEDVVIYTCGHSLGSIPSILLAAHLNLTKERTCCINYNFGSPRGFSKSSLSKVKALVPVCYRIADINDMVASLPPEFMNFLADYYHVGDCYAIKSKKNENIATITYVRNMETANNLFSLQAPNLFFHKMSHYIQSLAYLMEHHRVVGGSLRHEDDFIKESKATLNSDYKAKGKVLITHNDYAYKQVGRKYKGRNVYHQIGSEHLEFLPHYHKDRGLSLTPIPTTMKDAIVGVTFFDPKAFDSKGEVKGFILY